VGTAFIALWLEIAGVITIFVTLFNLIGAGSTTYVSSEVHPLGDSTIRGITIGLLLSIVGGYTALTHRSKAIELAGSEEAEASPSMRVVRSYAAVVSFISVIVVVIASLAFVWPCWASSRQAFIRPELEPKISVCCWTRRQCWQSSRGSSRLTGVWWGPLGPNRSWSMRTIRFERQHQRMSVRERSTWRCSHRWSHYWP